MATQHPNAYRKAHAGFGEGHPETRSGSPPAGAGCPLSKILSKNPDNQLDYENHNEVVNYSMDGTECRTRKLQSHYKEALGVAGGTLAIVAGIAAWIRTSDQSTDRPPTEKGRQLVEDTATAAGRDLPDRLSRMEAQVPPILVDVGILRASEDQRNLRLAQALDGIAALVTGLKHEMNRGDLEARVSAATSLVRALQVGVTLAKLSTPDAQDRSQAELREAERQLHDLMSQRQT